MIFLLKQRPLPLGFSGAPGKTTVLPNRQELRTARATGPQPWTQPTRIMPQFTTAQIAEKLQGLVLGDNTLALHGFAPADSAKHP